MPINFNDQSNEKSYAKRNADSGWQQAVKKLVDLKNTYHAADIGCGGGIYSKALADIGIPKVTGLDFSEAMINGAISNCQNYSQINFEVGNAYQTGLPNNTFDLVLERALIHHVTDLEACFSEAFRVMKYNGTIIIQDRTPEDCLLKGTPNHIRGYIFSKFPRLAEIEVKRRYSSQKVRHALKAVGFIDLEETKLLETRKEYTSKDELLTDIRFRNGRSILHELNDTELDQLVEHIGNHLGPDGIIEQDRWTLWKATKR